MGKAPDTVKRLIDRFTEQSDQVCSPDYNETLIRIDYINPLFKELGWDIDNSEGSAEQYRQVVHEDRVKVAGQTKAPDYSFRIGGQRKFFLEAKKPAVNIKDNHEPAYQLRRYAWSAKLACSLLTDFEELAIYDTRIKPKHLDKASTARREFIKYTDYIEKWDFLYGTFSFDAVRRGEFDRYCGTQKGRGAQAFDDAFLSEIEEWRKSLASNLALRNDSLDEGGLNFAVQRIIDRIIFLRMAEDRGTENALQLQALLAGDNTYQRLQSLFHRADERYNSGLFHFARERDREESPDTLTPDLDIDDKTLKEIIRKLYYPDSPYEFSVVTADILGSVYERFLGKVITLTPGHRAKIEEKPEVRKAGGVYYTPTYIVDYIVKNTVGKLLGGSPLPNPLPDNRERESQPRTPSPSTLGEGRGEGLTPKQAAKIKILDPACGSGSFLIGAYQFLLDWYLAQYLKSDPQKLCKGKNPVLRQTAVNPLAFIGERKGAEEAFKGFSLTVNERKRILLDHIHGVDLDSQAVEVTKLNLLLKCLEGETKETLGFSDLYARRHDRALPDLGKNIKCGNSLIGTDIIRTPAWEKMSEEERGKVNPFDYERAFPRVSDGGGFDTIIGNPPYIRVSNLDESIRPFLYATYALNHRFDIYVAFVERGITLLRDEGRLGFIVPNKFFTADYGRPTREMLTNARLIESVVDFEDKQVFAGATTYTCLLILGKSQRDTIDYSTAGIAPSRDRFEVVRTITVSHSTLSGHPWAFVSPSAAAMIERFKALPTLGSLYDIQHGLQTGLDDFFLLELIEDNGSSVVTVKSELEPNPFQVERHAVRTVVKGLVDLGRYAIRNDGRRVLFPYAQSERGVMPNRQEVIAREQPMAWAYVQRHRKVLEDRGATTWFAFRRRNYDLRDDLPRILVPSIATRASFTYDATGEVHFVGSGGGGGGGYGLNKLDGTTVDDRFILGLLNSRVIDWLVKQSNSRFGHGYYSFNRQFIEPLPIANTANQSSVITLVDAMLSLHQKLAKEQNPHRREQVQREIDATDRQIDALVYQLYGLTPEEIKIVEAATTSVSREVGG